MVLCFDHQLNLLWSQTIANITQTPGAYFVKSIAIMVISNSLNQGQTGLILVGGSRGQPHNDKRYRSIYWYFYILEVINYIYGLQALE